MRRLPDLLLLATFVLGWLAAGVATAPPAAAHAELVSTDPADGARLEQAPDRITLRFTEPVSLGAGYARVVGADGTVQVSSAAVDGDTVVVTPGGELPADAGYLVTYRVVSADSHPVAGAFSFTVGDAALVAADVAGEGTDPGIAVALPVSRWLGFAGLALAVGVPALVLFCWPAGWGSARLRRLAGWGAVAVGGSALLGFLLQGPYAAATGLGSMFDPALLSATLSSTAGWTLLVRAALAGALALVLHPAWRRGAPPSTARAVAAGVLALALVASMAAIGHPVAGPWPVLAVGTAAVHAAAMAVWLGGLVALLAVALRPGNEPADLAGALVPWSRIAFAAVAALVVSGTVQAVREVGSPAALGGTTYGRVLIAKLVLVLVLLGAAGVSRVWVQQRLGVRRAQPAKRRIPVHAVAGPPTLDEEAAVRGRLQAESAAEHLPALRRSVLVEAGVAAVVLALSAVLVGTPPARSAVAEPVDVVLPLQGSAGPDGSVQLSVDPARPGPNTLHLYLFDDAGRLTQPAGIRVTLADDQQGIGPLEVDLEPAGPGHYVGDGLSIPGAGTWTLAVSVRLDEFTATTASADFPVR